MTSVSCSSMSDVISFALDKEEKAMQFYRQCSERAKNPGIKEFFSEMVREEERHWHMLKGLDLDNLEGVRLDKVEDLHIGDYLLDVSFKENITYQEALTIAMKKEEKAHAFYDAWKGKCMHEKTAKVFEILATEELKHKRKLETLYDEEILAWD